MTTTTNLAPPPRRFPYQGLPVGGPDAAPSGELLFTGIGEAVTDGDAGGQIIAITCTCPPGFAYVLSDVSIEVIKASGTNNFYDRARLGIADGLSEGIRFGVYPMSTPGQVSYTALGSNNAKAYCVECTLPPRFMNFSDTAASPIFIAHLQNGTASETGYTCNFFFRILQFPIEQVYNWEANTPQLVR